MLAAIIFVVLLMALTYGFIYGTKFYNWIRQQLHNEREQVQQRIRTQHLRDEAEWRQANNLDQKTKTMDELYTALEAEGVVFYRNIKDMPRPKTATQQRVSEILEEW